MTVPNVRKIKERPSDAPPLPEQFVLSDDEIYKYKLTLVTVQDADGIEYTTEQCRIPRNRHGREFSNHLIFVIPPRPGCIIYNINTKIWLCGWFDFYGYHKFGLDMISGLHIGELILSTFVGPPHSSLHTVDHFKSNEKSNNQLYNLRWADKSRQSQNQIRQTKKGLEIAIYALKDGTEIRFDSVVQAARILNIDQSAISKVLVNKRKAAKGFLFKYEYIDTIENEIWSSIGDDGREMSNLCRYRKKVNGGYVQINLGSKSQYRKVSYFGEFKGEHVVQKLLFGTDDEQQMIKEGGEVDHIKKNKRDNRNESLQVLMPHDHIIKDQGKPVILTHRISGRTEIFRCLKEAAVFLSLTSVAVSTYISESKPSKNPIYEVRVLKEYEYNPDIPIPRNPNLPDPECALLASKRRKNTRRSINSKRMHICCTHWYDDDDVSPVYFKTRQEAAVFLKSRRLDNVSNYIAGRRKHKLYKVEYVLKE